MLPRRLVAAGVSAAALALWPETAAADWVEPVPGPLSAPFGTGKDFVDIAKTTSFKLQRAKKKKKRT